MLGQKRGIAFSIPSLLDSNPSNTMIQEAGIGLLWKEPVDGEIR
jgi:hypothetical protein